MTSDASNGLDGVSPAADQHADAASRRADAASRRADAASRRAEAAPSIANGSVASSAGSLLDKVIAANGPASERVTGTLDQFLQASSDAERLRLWLDRSDLNGLGREAVSRALARDIARLDAMLSRQVNAILHHPRFQQLEASWRGLKYLADQAGRAVEMMEGEFKPESLVIKVLNISKKELFNDLDRAIEFDQSQIFKKVYEAEFGMPGGEPYGVLLGDFSVTNHPDDIFLLRKISEVAAAAFAPFIVSASPELLGLDEFRELEQPVRLGGTFAQLNYLKWREFRESEDARFVGLVLPRVLMRLPYGIDAARVDGFRFCEEAEEASPRNFLFANACYAFGAVLVRTFAAAGWFAEIRGFERGVLGGGLVDGLSAHSFGTDARQVATKFSTEVAIQDWQEQELSELGFIPLCPCKDTDLSVFFSNASAHSPKKYDDPAATTNAKISSMLQYVLCVSRFAHYLKVIERDKVGGTMEATTLQYDLSKWIHGYVAPDEKASPEAKAKYPLREADVEVNSLPGKPGSYKLIFRLLPHSQLDELSATSRLVTTTRAAKPG